MLELTPTSRFRRDLKRFRHQTRILQSLDEILKKLVKQESLPFKNVDHPLGGDWIGSRECHITPDTLLIYRIDLKEMKLYLERVGSHSELFA